MSKKRRQKRHRSAKEKLEGFRPRDPLAAILKRPDSPYRPKTIRNKKKDAKPTGED